MKFRGVQFALKIGLKFIYTLHMKKLTITQTAKIKIFEIISENLICN